MGLLTTGLLAALQARPPCFRICMGIVTCIFAQLLAGPTAGLVALQLLQVS